MFPRFIFNSTSHSLEGKVIIRHNELLTGLLDKNQFGASAFGLVHVSTP